MSAAALDGKSFDGNQLLPNKSRLPDRDVIKYYTWTSDQSRVFLKQAPTTTNSQALMKWANQPITHPASMATRRWMPWQLNRCAAEYCA